MLFSGPRRVDLRLRRERLTDDGAFAIVRSVAVSADLVFRFDDFPPPARTAALFSQMGARAGIKAKLSARFVRWNVMQDVECNGVCLLVLTELDSTQLFGSDRIGSESIDV